MLTTKQAHRTKENTKRLLHTSLKSSVKNGPLFHTMVMHTDLVLVNGMAANQELQNKGDEPKNEKQTTASTSTSAAAFKNFLPSSTHWHLRIINSVKIWRAEIKMVSGDSNGRRETERERTEKKTATSKCLKRFVALFVEWKPTNVCIWYHIHNLSGFLTQCQLHVYLFCWSFGYSIIQNATENSQSEREENREKKILTRWPTLYAICLLVKCCCKSVYGWQSSEDVFKLIEK